MAVKYSIKGSSTLFIDTNIFIYALEDNGRLGEHSRNLLRQIKQQSARVYTSVLTIEEVLTGVFKESLDAKIPKYLEFISGGGLITILEFEQNTAIVCARLRAQYKLPRAKSPRYCILVYMSLQNNLPFAFIPRKCVFAFAHSSEDLQSSVFCKRI